MQAPHPNATYQAARSLSRIRDRQLEASRRPFPGADRSHGTLIRPRIPFECEVLRKDNIVVRDSTGYGGFNHLVARIRHPGRYDPGKPEVVLIPGILCNGNLFRLSWMGLSFRDLSHPHSFANKLAFEGYSVVIIHPRDSQWIYTRYAGDVLGIPNTFSDDFSIQDGVDDICFLLDVCSELRKREGADTRTVLVGFSLGGIKLIDLIGTRGLPNNVCGLAFLGTPIEFESNRETLIPLLRIYTQIARILPVEHYSALNVLDRNLIKVKRLARIVLGDASPRLAGEIIKRVPLISDVFHVDDPDFDLRILLPMVSYVVEPVSRMIMRELLHAVRVGHLVRLDTDEDLLDLFPEVLPPWLLLRGARDRIVTSGSQEVLCSILSDRNDLGRAKNVERVGHDDMIVSQAVVDEVLGFLRRLP